MRILYLTFDDLTVPYAWSVHVRSIINRLVKRGHTVKLVAPNGSAPGIDAPCDPLPPGRLHHLAGSLGTFVRSGESFKPDVIYARGIHMTLTPALAAGRLEKPLVVEVNGLLEVEAPAGWRRVAVRAAHRFTLARAARVVTVSPLLKDALTRLYEFPAERIDVVPNGADTTLFQPGDRTEARRRLGLPDDRPILVCVASFYAHHALDVLRDAASRVKAHLVLVGGRSPVPHEQVPSYVAAADVCVYALKSPDPGFGFSPLKVYEYMAGGRPIAAATNLEEVNRFVNENGIGKAVPPDPGALAVAIEGLLADPAGRERMGRRGRELAESVYNWDRATASVEECLSKVQ